MKDIYENFLRPTMEAFGKLHSYRRNHSHWGQMSARERKLRVDIWRKEGVRAETTSKIN